MNTITKQIGTTEYVIVNQSYGTRNGFAHKSTLMRNGVQINEAKVNYLNRTWESYQFQTSMKICVESMIGIRCDQAINNWKSLTGKKRLTKEQKKEVIAQSYLNVQITELRELLNTL